MTEANVIYLPTPKDPQSEEDFNWRVTPMLKVGDSIAAVTSIFVERGDASLVIVSVPAIDGTGQIVSTRLRGGRRGVRYRVTIRFTTVSGEILDMSIEFDCC